MSIAAAREDLRDVRALAQGTETWATRERGVWFSGHGSQQLHNGSSARRGPFATLPRMRARGRVQDRRERHELASPRGAPE